MGWSRSSPTRLSEVIIQQRCCRNSAPAISMAGSKAGVDALIQQLSLDTSAAEARAAAAAQQAQTIKAPRAAPARFPSW